MNRLSSVAIIPDGNRRYAKKAGIPIEQSYLKGFENVGRAVQWAHESRVDTITFWALSLDNFRQRSRDELKTLFKILSENLEKAIKRRALLKQGVRARFFGRLEELPVQVLEKIRFVERQTAENRDVTVNIAIAYNGRDEILHAARRAALEAQRNGRSLDDLTEKEFETYLYYPQTTDLIIRTGNVSRLSGFMPWQSAYSELYFSPKLWPEFTQTDFQQAVEFYAATQRNFGK